MIRNTLFGISLLALSAGSAFAAPVKHPVAAKSHIVAQSDTAAPSADKPAKKMKKSSKKAKSTDATKSAGTTDGTKQMKAAPAPEAK